ncbi:MAG TPA: serine/threonine-protein kinase [Candidatus Angelobacter sp.]|jgi:serine/threonine-protein kinase|nr:serine/threonine-protein kinase [Candidatus Angelobacter sp.]
MKWKDRRDHLCSTVEFLLDERKEVQPDLFTPERIILPKAFQKYELLDHIEEGGFASVLSCVDIHSGRPYALKILRTENRFNKQLLHRFFREIRILRSFRNEHVIRLHEDNLDSQESFPAFVMDLAECSLTQYLDNLKQKDGRGRPYLEVHEATALFRSIFLAVLALHNHNPKIIHRDINPNNILLLPERKWVLADFGLSKFVRTAAIASSFVTNTRRGGGTTFYAAPEQHEDFTKTDERTDIFALGMLLWELFTKASGPAWPQMAQPDLPQGFDSVFKRAVQREQSDRYRTVDELISDFEKALGASGAIAQKAVGPST